MNRKGIILAGGLGRRLNPITLAVSKQLLPIYDKPLIYYPLSTMMLCGIKNVLIITTPDHNSLYKSLLGDGSQFGISISYVEQPKPEGLAQALILAESFLNGSPSAMILGDNIFYGSNIKEVVCKGEVTEGAVIFTKTVGEPWAYGVATVGPGDEVIDLEEKPQEPKSNLAVTGLYFFDKNATEYAKKLQPSKRGELEITELNRMYLKKGKLKNVYLGQDVVWFDAGTVSNMLEASNFVATLEQQYGVKVSCPEEVALRQNFLSRREFEESIRRYCGTPYGDYLKSI